MTDSAGHHEWASRDDPRGDPPGGGQHRDGDAAYLFDTVVAEVRDDDAAPFGLAWPVSIARRPHRADVRLALERTAEARTKVMYGRTPGGLVLWRYGLELLDVDGQLRADIFAAVVWNLTRNPAVR